MSTKAMWSLLSTPWSPREADVCSMLPLDRRSERHLVVAPKSPNAFKYRYTSCALRSGSLVSCVFSLRLVCKTCMPVHKMSVGGDLT